MVSWSPAGVGMRTAALHLESYTRVLKLLFKVQMTRLCCKYRSWWYLNCTQLWRVSAWRVSPTATASSEGPGTTPTLGRSYTLETSSSNNKDFLVGVKGRNGTWILNLPLHISLETRNDAGWDCLHYVPLRWRNAVSFLLSQFWRHRVDGLDSVHSREVLQICNLYCNMAWISWSLLPQACFLRNVLLSRL